MPRPPKYIEVKLVDFCELAFAYLTCRMNPEILGEFDAKESYYDLLQKVGELSSVKVTLPQLDSLFFHYKQCYLQKKPPVLLPPKPTFEEIFQLFKRMKTYLPEIIVTDKFKDFNVIGYDPWKLPKAAGGKRLTKIETKEQAREDAKKSK
jgi:hypothetical protein